MNRIPSNTGSGVLPPFLGSPTGSLVSPYLVRMSDLVGRYATSKARIALLKGFFDYRKDLAAAGISEGLQWIGGSFVENVETLRKRSPKDFDFVTFARFPASVTDKTKFVTTNPDIFLSSKAKDKYKCDARFVDLGIKPELLVDQTKFYVGLYSHQTTTSLWKGILAVSLACDDTDAMSALLLREGELDAA